MRANLKIIAVSLCLLFACQKEPIDNNKPIEKAALYISLTLDDAQKFIAQLEPDDASTIAKIKIDWRLAKMGSVQGGNKWTIPLEGQPTYQHFRQGYRELILLRDKESQAILARILEIIPDAIYLQKKRRSSASDFTGRVFEYDLNYRLIGGRLYSEGKPIGKIQQFLDTKRIGESRQMTKSINPFSGVQGQMMPVAVETCTWLQDTYIDAEGDLTIHSTQVCATTYFDDISMGSGGFYTGVGEGSTDVPYQGGGDGGTESSTPPAPSNLPGEDKNAVNPREMMECFSKISSPNAAFVVRVYVVEPQPGTSFNVGANSFGHVAISLSKTSGSTTITQTVGFYPTGTGLDKLMSRSQIIDNGFDAYNISATYYVNSDSFQKVIDFVSNPPSNYHFTDYNCSAFVYGAGQASGIPIPDPTTQIGLGGPGGSGFAKTPAGMASALREQKANNPNSDINEAGGKIPESNGPCNIQ